MAMIPYLAVRGKPSLEQLKADAETDDADNVEENNDRADELSASIVPSATLKSSSKRRRHILKSSKYLNQVVGFHIPIHVHALTLH